MLASLTGKDGATGDITLGDEEKNISYSLMLATVVYHNHHQLKSKKKQAVLLLKIILTSAIVLGMYKNYS